MVCWTSRGGSQVVVARIRRIDHLRQSLSMPDAPFFVLCWVLADQRQLLLFSLDKRLSLL